MTEFHPELRRAARLIPRFSFSPWLVRFARRVQKFRGVPKPPSVQGVTIRDLMVPGPAGAEVRVRLYYPENVGGPVPLLLWIHGGGFIIGSPEQDQDRNIAMARDHGIAVAATTYRLAPDHPFPAALEDCYAALRWLHDEADALGLRRDRIAIGGGSAGGGLAAGLVLMAHDRGEVPVVFQLLIYPMIDDRTTLRTNVDEAMLRLWSTKSNRFGWGAYLNAEPGGDDVSHYAAPARREDLGGLPPAWVGVGTFDLFHDEDVRYAERLREAGVPCDLYIVEGAYHGFDAGTEKTNLVQEFRRTYTQALCRVLQADD